MEISAESLVKSDLTPRFIDLHAIRARKAETRIVSGMRRALHARFPLAFMKFAVPKIPLMKGILEAVLAAEPSFRKSQVKRAIGDYVNGRTYLRAMIEGTPRINLNGDPSGQFVTAAEAEFSVERLEFLNKAYGEYPRP